MTELEQKIDQAVGQDTENQRVTYLKFVSLGRQLESEERLASGQYTKAEVLGVLKEVDAIMAEAGAAAWNVEKVDEKEILAGLNDGSPLYAQVETMIKTVDEKHTAINKARDQKLADLILKYT